jgi:hypothetical protein
MAKPSDQLHVASQHKPTSGLHDELIYDLTWTLVQLMPSTQPKDCSQSAVDGAKCEGATYMIDVPG